MSTLEKLLEEIEPLMQNIEGPTPEISKDDQYNQIDIRFDRIRFTVSPSNSTRTVIPIEYRQTFDSTDAKWLTDQDITYWEIYKGYLEFNKKVPIKELATFIQEILDRFL